MNKYLAVLISFAFVATSWAVLTYSIVSINPEIHWLLFFGAFGFCFIGCFGGMLFDRLIVKKRHATRRVTDQKLDIGDFILDDMYFSTEDRLK